MITWRSAALSSQFPILIAEFHSGFSYSEASCVPFDNIKPVIKKKKSIPAKGIKYSLKQSKEFEISN